MGICSDECNCYVEGERGLISDGIGTAGDPYTPQPDAGRTIPRTVANAAALPVYTIAEDGQLAFVNDTALVYRFNGATLAWEGVGPEWVQTFPADVDVGDGGSNVFVLTTESIPLADGRWSIHANGSLLVDFDFIDPGDQTSQPEGSFGFEEVAPEVLITMFDSVSASDLAFVQAEVSSETFWQFLGGFQINQGRARRYQIPFHIQHTTNGPRDVYLRAKWTPLGLDSWGGMELRNLHLMAHRVANHDFNI